MFLLCYKVTDIASLFSAISVWVPELRARAPVTPIVVVGLQAELRGDRATIHSLAKLGRAPVSPDQARSFSQQIEAVTYVETSAKLSSRGPEAIFQLAAQISMEQVKERERPPQPSHAPTSSPSNSLERTTESPELFWDQFQSPPLPRSHFHSRSASLSSSLNSTRSTISLPVARPRSPLSHRSSMSLRSRPSNGQDKFIKIKCQRLNENKIFEEVEIEVPAPIYETLQASNESRANVEINGSLKRKESFGSRLRSLFVRE